MTSSTSPPSTKLYRSETDCLIGGVCGGIADFFEIDSALIRLIFVSFILFGGSGLLLYILLWIIIPEAGDEASQKEAKMAKIDNRAIKSESKKIQKNSKSVWGIILIVAGIIMLLQNFGVAQFLMLEKTWPIMLVVLGFLILK